MPNAFMRFLVSRFLLSRGQGSVVKILSSISVAGIALGVMAMIVILSVMEGFDDAIKNRLLGVEPHLVIEDSSPDTLSKLKVFIGDRGKVERFAKQDVIVRTVDGLYSGAEAIGVDPDKMASLGVKVSRRVSINPLGKTETPIDETDNTPFVVGPKEIVLGSDLARGLGVFEGDELTIIAPESLLLPAGELPSYQKVKVRGLLKANVQDIDRGTMYYDLSSGLRKLGDSSSLVQGFEVRLETPSMAHEIAKELTEEGFTKIKTWEDLNSTLFYALKMEKILMAVFLGLTVLIASFSIVAVLSLLVTEKTSDVGILKAIGATRPFIRQTFIYVGIALGSLGIVGGALLGLFTCWILDTFPIIKLPDIYYDTTVPVSVEKGVIVAIVALGMLLSFFGALIPAWKISQLDPIKAIRG